MTTHIGHVAESSINEGMWNYIGGARRLPVQWVSWLSHTRRDPPTLEELRADLERHSTRDGGRFIPINTTGHSCRR
ncbi:hypothetical protein BC827DRAFT_1196051 [Russula dissimulans]|nr:hypothetical protein BC827DRAFT_1196051 [Russula dissimulans]